MRRCHRLDVPFANLKTKHISALAPIFSFFFSLSNTSMRGDTHSLTHIFGSLKCKLSPLAPTVSIPVMGVELKLCACLCVCVCGWDDIPSLQWINSRTHLCSTHGLIKYTEGQMSDFQGFQI